MLAFCWPCIEVYHGAVNVCRGDLSSPIPYEMGVRSTELPCVAGRYGTSSAVCAVLVSLQISITYSVVKAEKINSFKMVVGKFKDALRAS